MLSTDRTEFDAQVATLCAGFNVPATPDRQEAFWIGMGKMSLVEFTRAVEFALSEEGPDKFPTTKALWRLHREIKLHSRARADHIVREAQEQDHLLFYANRMLLRHLISRGGLGSVGRFVPGYGIVDCQASAELLAARKFVRGLVDWWSTPIREADSDATQAEFIRQFLMGLDKVSPVAAATRREWEERQLHPDARLPFPASMGRELPARYQPEPAQLELAR